MKYSVEDYKNAGTIQQDHVDCAWCMTRFDLAPRETYPVNWHFIANTVGWLCTTCYETYCKGYTFSLKCGLFHYHLACALQHNIIQVSDANKAIEIIQNDLRVQKSQWLDKRYGVIELGYGVWKVWCEQCGAYI
jgi:hypothetical protein